MIADALLNETGWISPSDALLPDRHFDVYESLPAIGGSTEPEEGTLL